MSSDDATESNCSTLKNPLFHAAQLRLSCQGLRDLQNEWVRRRYMLGVMVRDTWVLSVHLPFVSVWFDTELKNYKFHNIFHMRIITGQNVIKDGGGKSVRYKNMKKLANIYRTLFYFKNFTHRNQQLSNKQQLSFWIFRNIHNIMSKIIIHTRYVWESLVFNYLQVFVTNETMENFTGFCCNRAFSFFLNSSSHKWVTPKTNQQKEVFMEQGIPEKWKQMCI